MIVWYTAVPANFARNGLEITLAVFEVAGYCSRDQELHETAEVVRPISYEKWFHSGDLLNAYFRFGRHLLVERYKVRRLYHLGSGALEEVSMASFGQRVGRTGAPLPRLWDVKILEARVFPRRTEMSGRNDLGNTSPVSELVTLYGDSRRGWPPSRRWGSRGFFGILKRADHHSG